MEVALAEFDLTPTQFLMLFHLRDRHEVSAASLAREVGVRPQSVIEILAPLERKRLVRREASPAHRRILHTHLTTAGQNLLADALRIAARIEAELLVDLNDSQLSTLQEALTKLWARAERHELHPGSIRAKAEGLMHAQLAVRQRRSLRASSRPARRD
jgi:DNA-binding MarR family transcriptional regulator